MQNVGYFFVALIVAFLLIMNAAYPASLMWNWFVSPLGLPEIGFANAAGIILTLSAFKIKAKAKKDGDDKQPSEIIALFSAAVLSPWFALLFSLPFKG